MNSKVIKQWVVDGCLWYTAISVCFLLINFFSNDMTGTAITTRSFLLMIPCGLTISVGTQFLKSESVARWARYLLHYAFMMLAIILFLIVPSDSAATPTTNFLMIVFISIVYWIIFFLCVFIAAKFKKTAKRK
jgi:hypothetical protein